jgi:hypothetical protein
MLIRAKCVSTFYGKWQDSDQCITYELQLCCSVLESTPLDLRGRGTYLQRNYKHIQATVVTQVNCIGLSASSGLAPTILETASDAVGLNNAGLWV